MGFTGLIDWASTNSSLLHKSLFLVVTFLGWPLRCDRTSLVFYLRKRAWLLLVTYFCHPALDSINILQDKEKISTLNTAHKLVEKYDLIAVVDAERGAEGRP